MFSQFVLARIWDQGRFSPTDSHVLQIILSFGRKKKHYIFLNISLVSQEKSVYSVNFPDLRWQRNFLICSSIWLVWLPALNIHCLMTWAYSYVFNIRPCVLLWKKKKKKTTASRTYVVAWFIQFLYLVIFLKKSLFILICFLFTWQITKVPAISYKPFAWCLSLLPKIVPHFLQVVSITQRHPSSLMFQLCSNPLPNYKEAWLSWFSFFPGKSSV